MSRSGQQQWQVQAEHSGSLIRLQNLIQRGSGSCLLILQQNRPSYRDGLIEFLGQEHSRVLNLKEPGGFDAFEAELEKGEQGRILHLINLESLGEEKQRAFFKGLNYHREHIARTCSGILAFWLPEPLVREMALQAADFWAWREQVLDFTVPVEPVERIAFDWVKNSNMEVAGKQERIREIEEFLAHAEEQSSLSTADLKHELGSLYKMIGEYDQAEQMFTETIADYCNLDEAKACAHARHDLAEVMADQGKYEQALKIFREQVLPVNKSLNDVRNKAVTMGKIADILHAKGQLDEALQIRREEELPVYEKIGDVQAKAITMGKIADILLDRGQLDKALEIRQQEELPVYERLGDIQSKAATMGQIADILQEKGQLDEALEIRQQNELPVYERLGDVRAKAVTMGKIAYILRARGQLDEALNIYHQEMLPVFERLG
uniref:tetratricopeptide repeat protein n=1 Tax=Candidatus Electrothrix sp. TaxID=2170559 RepID=UPI004055F9B3